MPRIRTETTARSPDAEAGVRERASGVLRSRGYAGVAIPPSIPGIGAGLGATFGAQRAIAARVG